MSQLRAVPKLGATAIPLITGSSLASAGLAIHEGTRGRAPSGLGRARLNQQDDDRIACRADAVPVKRRVIEDFSISSNDYPVGVAHLRISGGARRLKPRRPVHLISPSVVRDRSDLVSRLRVDDELHGEGQCSGRAQIGIRLSQLQDGGLLGRTPYEAQQDGACENDSHRQHLATARVNGRRRVARRIEGRRPKRSHRLRRSRIRLLRRQAALIVS